MIMTGVPTLIMGRVDSICAMVRLIVITSLLLIWNTPVTRIPLYSTSYSNQSRVSDPHGFPQSTHGYERDNSVARSPSPLNPNSYLP